MTVFALVGIIIYTLISCILTSYIVVSAYARRRTRRQGQLSQLLDESHVILVTAHPDDEVMFFFPLMKYVDVVLCLSDGNVHGLGNVRRNELSTAVTQLGRNQQATAIIPSCDGRFQDGFHHEWKTEDVAGEIASVVDRICSQDKKPVTIFTFDECGISQHPNHIACYLGLQEYVRKTKQHSEIHAFTLKSDFHPVKYSGIVGAAAHILWSTFRSHPINDALFNPSFTSAYKGMTLHASQFVWYRRLFVILARCVFMNEFSKMSVVR